MLVERADLFTCSVLNAHPFFLVLQQVFQNACEPLLLRCQHPGLVL